MNPGRGDGRTAGVRGARHAAPGPVFGDPVAVIGTGTIGLLLRARGRVLLPSWTGSASGCRSSRKLGAAQAVTDASALDGVCLEVAVDAPGRRRQSEPRRAARPLRADGGLRCVPAPAAISVSPFRVYHDKVVITEPMAILRAARPGRTAGIEWKPLLRHACLDRVPAGGISISSLLVTLFWSPIRSVTDLGIPPATEAISMPDSSPGIQAQVGPDCAGAGWRSRSRPGL